MGTFGEAAAGDRRITAGCHPQLVPSVTRAFDRGTYLAEQDLRDVGSEFRERRLSLASSQAHVAGACRMSRPRYSRIEAGKAGTLTLPEIHRIASVLGLHAVLRIYPGGIPVRDRAHAVKLRELLAHAAAPLSHRQEVPLQGGTSRSDLRAWDSVIYGNGERTAVELEMRLRDIQAAERRQSLKRRDDPTEHFLLVVADTKGNRRVLREIVAFADLPRLRPTDVIRALEAGQHPPSGLVLH